MKYGTIALSTLAGLALASLGITKYQTPQATTKPTIVLVHGAFTDASGWGHVISILLHDGYNVIGVQNPMDSFEDDVATTKRVMDAQKGPMVLSAIRTAAP